MTHHHRGLQLQLQYNLLHSQKGKTSKTEHFPSLKAVQVDSGGQRGGNRPQRRGCLCRVKKQKNLDLWMLLLLSKDPTVSVRQCLCKFTVRLFFFHSVRLTS